MNIISYRGSSGCRVLIVSHNPSWSRQPHPHAAPYGHIRLTCTNSPGLRTTAAVSDPSVV